MTHTIQEHRKRKPMWVYEKNFILLSRLLPELENRDEIECGRLDVNVEQPLNVKVTERSRYTITLEIWQNLHLPDQFMQKLVMKIRLYYDAKMAEVLSCQGFSCLLLGIKKRGMKYYEKRQTNILLHDWLSALLHQYHKQKPEYA